jgi:hypothetical protein
MADRDRIVKDLSAAGERRSKALRDLDAADREIDDLIIKAVAAGVQKIEIAVLSGLSRPTVDARIKARATTAGEQAAP